MGVFENAKKIETRKAFVDNKVKRFRYSPERLADLEEYVLSDECWLILRAKDL